MTGAVQFGWRAGVLLGILLSLVVPALSLDPRTALNQYGITKWGDDASLPSLTINDVLQTHDGYLWIASDSGLVRFDGRRFVTYLKSNSDLISNKVLSLWEDPQHVLWIGFSGSGACSMDQGRFHCLGEHDGLPKGSVRGIRSDSQGAVWLAIVGAGLVRVQDGKLHRFTKKDGLASDSVTSVFVARDGTVWAGTFDAGASFLQNNQFHSIGKPTLPSNLVWSIAEDKKGSIYLATFAGLCKLQSIQDARPTVYDKRNGLLGADVTTVHIDPQDTVWVGTDHGGISRLEASHFTTLTQEDGLADASMTALADDQEGDLWLATKGGLSRLRDQTFAMVGKRQGLPDEAVRVAFQDHSGSLWLGLVNKGVVQISQSDRGSPFNQRLHREEMEGCSPLAGYEDREQTVWFGCAGGTILEDRSGKVRRFTLGTTSRFVEVNALAETPDGHMVAATFSAGLAEYIDGVWKPHAFLPNIDHFTSLLMTKGGLWIASLQDGLYQLRPNGAVFSYAKQFKGTQIFRVSEDSDGSVWIEGDHGLAHLDGGEVKWIHLEGTPLKDQNLYNLLDDKLGWYWISSDRGIYRISRNYLLLNGSAAPDANQVRFFGKSDGVRAVNYQGFAEPTAVRLRDGTLCFATSKGLIYTDPAKVTALPKPPLPLIETVSADDRTADLDLAEGVSISPNPHRVQITFTGINLSRPENLRFAYRLTGVDSGWIPSENNRSVTYTNVPPGTYEFEVKSSMGEGGEFGSIRRIALRVQPAFYQTLWFKTLGAAALLLGVFCSYRWQIRRIRRIAAALEAVRTEEQRKAAAQRTWEMAKANQELEVRNRLLAVVAEVATRLSRTHDFDAGLHECLGLIGMAGQFSRVLILREEPSSHSGSGSRHIVVAEWCAPNITTHLECDADIISSKTETKFLRQLRAGQAFWCRIEDVSSPVREGFERLNIKATGCAPLVLDGVYWGSVAYDDCLRNDAWDSAHIDALTVIAQAISNSLQTRLDAERLAAERLRQEEERKAAAAEKLAELTHANAAMRRCLDGIASAEDLGHLQGAVLGVFVEVFGAITGSLWSFDASDGSVTLQVESLHGKLLSRTQSRFEHGQKHFFLPSHAASFEKHQRLIAGDTLTLDIETSDMFVLNEREHLRENGVVTLIVVPLSAAGRHLGRLALAFDRLRRFSAAEMELATALATQASLIVEMTRLADASERGAVAREQERATVEERTRLAREIHDTLAQGFSGILAQLRAMQQAERHKDYSARLHHLDNALELASGGLTEARRSLASLRLLELEGRSFREALNLMATSAMKRASIQIRVLAEDEVEVRPEYESELLRIAQESVTNAIKHSGASAITIALRQGAGTVDLCIEDDGRGFDPKTTTEGFGLLGIQERAARIGATMTIESSNAGTAVCIHLKKEDNNARP